VFLSLYETIPAQPFTVVEKLSSAVPSAQAVVFGVPEEEVVKPEELDEEPPEELEKDEDDELEDDELEEELLDDTPVIEEHCATVEQIFNSSLQHPCEQHDPPHIVHPEVQPVVVIGVLVLTQATPCNVSGELVMLDIPPLR